MGFKQLLFLAATNKLAAATNCYVNPPKFRPTTAIEIETVTLHPNSLLSAALTPLVCAETWGTRVLWHPGVTG